MTQFWQNTIERLKALEITQADIARELGISRSIVHNWIKHDRFPPVDRAVKIANLLNRSVEDLFEGSDKSLEDFELRVKNDQSFRNTVRKLSDLDRDHLNKIQGMIDLYHLEHQRVDQSVTKNA